jgi:serine/threonine-protein kinase RsbT
MALEARQPSHAATGSLPISDDLDVLRCRQVVGHLPGAVNFSPTGATMLVTAASELARNTFLHGGGGTFYWELLKDGAREGLRLRFEDSGPGISDIPLAMTNGWTSKKGLGLGLPGAKRLVHEFHVQSTPGRGTTVVIA